MLDTHVFIWFTSRPQELKNDALLAIEDSANDVYISAAVGWEIAIKHARGKLTLPIDPSVYIPSRLRATGIRELPITLDHALATETLPALHTDPFDRIMIAQAQVEGMTFVTRDARSLAYPVHRLTA